MATKLNKKTQSEQSSDGHRKSKAFSRVFLLGLFAIFVFAIALPPAEATHISCETILSSSGTYTMDSDIINCGGAFGVFIFSSSITLDCNGHKMDGIDGPTASGIIVQDFRSNITIKNCEITDWTDGIAPRQVSGLTIDSNNITSNGNGISTIVQSGKISSGTMANNLINSNGNGISIVGVNNIISGNTVNSNTQSGILLQANIDLGSSSFNTISGNTANSNGIGISLRASSNNVIESNTAKFNTVNAALQIDGGSGNKVLNNQFTDNAAFASGIYLTGGSTNTEVTGNILSSNTYAGIVADNSAGNTIRLNTFESNANTGIELASSSSNTVYNNNFINNPAPQIAVFGSPTGNIFDLPAPDYGNFWSDHSCTDNDNNNICENAKTFTGGSDNAPWVCQNGWVTGSCAPPTIDHNTVTLRTVGPGNPKPTPQPVAGVVVKVFDQAVVGNPPASQYPTVYETQTPLSQCTTDTNGMCDATDPAVGNYLVIAKLVDPAGTAYQGKTKGPSDFVDTNNDGIGDKASLTFSFIKNPSGVNAAGSRQVSGSVLEIVYPEAAAWDVGTSSYVYPYIFTSDSQWTVDVCVQIPSGYTIKGYYDNNWNFVAGGSCTQAFVAGEAKVIAFDVAQTGSPKEFDVVGKIKAKHNGKTQNVDVRTPSVNPNARGAARAPGLTGAATVSNLSEGQTGLLVLAGLAVIAYFFFRRKR